MGVDAMNWVLSFIIILAVLLAVFAQVRVEWFREIFGTQFDLLPAFMVYAGLNSSIMLMTTIALFGGLLLDSFSSNPLGASVIPLFIIGFVHHQNRSLLLRTTAFAQSVLGLSASATAPLFTCLIILALGESPIIGVGFIWQTIVSAAFGAVVTPALFLFLGRIQKAFDYQQDPGSSFRPDREIKRGRF